MANKIKGEEVNVFTNALGETISIEIKDDVEGTAATLEKILDGDSRAATILATEVHREVDISDANVDSVELPADLAIDLTTLGIWIDPIGIYYILKDHIFLLNMYNFIVFYHNI